MGQSVYSCPVIQDTVLPRRCPPWAHALVARGLKLSGQGRDVSPLFRVSMADGKACESYMAATVPS